MAKTTTITNPDGLCFELEVQPSPYPNYSSEDIVVFLVNGTKTGASYYVSDLAEGDDDLGLVGNIPEWWVSRENINDALAALGLR